jgi:hypothetical protein
VPDRVPPVVVAVYPVGSDTLDSAIDRAYVVMLVAVGVGVGVGVAVAVGVGVGVGVAVAVGVGVGVGVGESILYTDDIAPYWTPFTIIEPLN